MILTSYLCYLEVNLYKFNHKFKMSDPKLTLSSPEVHSCCVDFCNFSCRVIKFELLYFRYSCNFFSVQAKKSVTDELPKGWRDHGACWQGLHEDVVVAASPG